MLTLDELMGVLSEHYTSEEIIDILKVSPETLVDGLEDYIEEHYNEVHKTLEEDGYVGGD